MRRHDGAVSKSGKLARQKRLAPIDVANIKSRAIAVGVPYARTQKERLSPFGEHLAAASDMDAASARNKRDFPEIVVMRSV